MELSSVKSVLVGVGAAAVVIAITGAASGTGVGAVFNLGEINKVNATSSLTGSTEHSMLSITNKGAGTALSLNVAKGTAPLSVNSSKQVAGLNASLLGGLAAGQFVQGGGRSQSFGMTMPVTSNGPYQNLLSVPGFGTFKAQCILSGGTFASVEFLTGSQAIDSFTATLDSAHDIAMNNALLPANHKFAIISATVVGEPSAWAHLALRYATGSKGSLVTHIATVDVMVGASSPSCDFDASAIIGPGLQGP